MCNHHKPSSNQTVLHGSSLEHGQAHERDHQLWSRRHFLRTLGLAGSSSLLLGGLPVTAMAASPLAYALNNSDGDRILVLIRLKGGNDGLNTIIPLFDYSRYQALRPTLAIRRDQIIGLNDAFGIPRSMEPLQRLWLDGAMRVIHNVGYPEQNLSHFRSSDIWASSSDAGEIVGSGWLGRYLDGEYPDFLTSPPDIPPAVQIGGSGNLTFTNEEGIDMAVIVNNPEELSEIARNGALYDAENVPDCYYGEQLSFLRSVANSTFRYAGVIAGAFEAGVNQVNYNNPLGEQLALVARLIKGGLGSRLYMVGLDGFDTHARQDQIHPNLLSQLASALSAFYADLSAGGHAQRVLTATQSEFGRRPEQNASNGTDHGAAAPLMIFGPGLGGNGFAGSPPDLGRLDPVGNLRFGVDFRQVYATLLEGWLCVPGPTVNATLGANFQRLPALGLNCALTSTQPPTAQPPLSHQALWREGQLLIRYGLSQPAPVLIQVFNILGQPIATLTNEHQTPGQYETRFRPLPGFAAGNYVYTIRAGNQRVSGKFGMR